MDVSLHVVVIDDPTTQPLVAALRAIADDPPTDATIHVHTVPRSYTHAHNLVRADVLAEAPDVAVLMDVDPDSEDYRLEVFAANYDDHPEPDADGIVHTDHIVDPEGPVAYRSKLPLDGIWDKLLVERVPARMSHKAGGHVFNHAYYGMMHAIAGDSMETLGGALRTPPIGTDAAHARPADAAEEELRMILAVLTHLYPAALRAEPDAEDTEPGQGAPATSKPK